MQAVGGLWRRRRRAGALAHFGCQPAEEDDETGRNGEGYEGSQPGSDQREKEADAAGVDDDIARGEYEDLSGGLGQKQDSGSSSGSPWST